MFTAEVEVTESCSNHRSLRTLVDRVTAEMDLQLTELCTDFVSCDSVLNLYVCQPADFSSLIIVNFTITVRMASQPRGQSNLQSIRIIQVFPSVFR